MSLMDATNDEQPSVIDVNQLSSDLEADVDDQSARDDEINLLNDKEIACTNNSSSYASLAIHKQRYRELVHAIRQLNSKLESERNQHKHHEQELKKQIAAFKDGRDNNHRNRNSDSISLINVASEGEIASKHNSHRPSSKLRDLEKLMAKCKESLKAKNQQLKILNDSLLEVDKFKEYIDGVKNELQDLRRAHETWTLSIAESKRVMHHEIEDKNLEIEKLKAEIKDLQAQLKDSINKSIQLKSNIQSLESRLVSTSAAHQKERESLTKELVAAKNNAIKQLQKEHELNLERVKLDLERSIENLKLELLVKDEQIIRNAEREHCLQEQTHSLKTDLESVRVQLSDALDEQTKLRSISEEQEKELLELRKLKSAIETSDEGSEIKVGSEETEITATSEDIANLRASNDELAARNQEMTQQLEDLKHKLSSMEAGSTELEQKLKESEQALSEQVQNNQVKTCDKCPLLEAQISQEADRYEQSSFELKTKLDLMTTANGDQEKVLQDLKSERDKATQTYRSLKLEFDELNKRNETMSQVIQENEAEMLSQQEQLKQLAATKQQLEALKRENTAQASNLAQVNSELNDRLDDLKKAHLAVDDLKKRLSSLEQETRSISQSSEVFKRERDALVADLAAESKRRRDLEQQLVVSILAAMKNLDTPDTSPGSDKTYKSDVPDSSDTSQERNLPDPLRLAEELSSLALDRSNAYMTSNQRLQAVLLDNTMINEEIKRLKEELNALNKEKSNEVLASLEEVDRLRSENQALIHDQKAYDDQVASLESEIEQLKNQIAEAAVAQPQQSDAATATDDNLVNQLALKEREVEQLKQLMAEKEQAEQQRQRQQQSKAPKDIDVDDVPDPTEFRYLKNIVYQFMMGREPTTLARVISAVFKFEQEQVEQICKIQEAIHQVSG